MALKSNREGLRNELVDYLGNIIIDKKLKQDIITAIDGVFVNESDVLTLEEIQASTDLSGKIASASAAKSLNENKFSVIYKQFDWNATHTFRIDRRTIGFMYTDDGTLYIYVIWATGDVSLYKIGGNNTLTCTLENNILTVNMSVSKALIVVGC